MNWIRRLMAGRYGSDPLTLCLLALYMLLYLVSALTGWYLLAAAAMLLIALALYRTLSRNVEKRRAENAKFLHFFAPVIGAIRSRRCVRKDKDHCYFKCPNCGQRLRVPKGKGKITVTCRSCGVSFQEKS